MFDLHNKYTKLTYLLLGMNSVTGIIHLIILFYSHEQQALPSQSTLVYLCAIILLNTYNAVKVYQRSKAALTISLWLYVIQIFGFATATWSIDLSFGMLITVALIFGDFKLTVNFFALIMCLIIVKAMRKLNTAAELTRQWTDEEAVGRE